MNPSTELFDSHSGTYVAQINRLTHFTGKSTGFFTQVKVARLLSLCARLLRAPSDLEVLDVGCGIGLADALLLPHVKRLEGIDVSSVSLERAREANPGAGYRVFDGKRFPYPDNAFDVCFAICVLHHVPSGGWAGFAAEMARVTKPGGLCVVFEHNPYHPLTQWVVSRCEFDKEAVLLSLSKTAKLLSASGLSVVEKRGILYFPADGKFLARVEKLLGWIPFGAQHYAAARKC